MSINKVFWYISEKYGVKYLTIQKGDPVLEKYNEVILGLKNHIQSKGNKEVTFNDEYNKIKFLSKVDLLLDNCFIFQL